MSIFPIDKTYISILALLLATTGVMGYESIKMRGENQTLSEELFHLQQEQETTTERFNNALLSLGESLDLTKGQQELLRSDLQTEKQKASVIEAQLGQVSGTVTTLEKLTKTDEELLQKYSKVYFLNEHYIPARLSRIDPPYVYDTKTPKKELQIHASVWPYLKNMVDAADRATHEDVFVISAYRSFGTQEVLKSNYVITYGSGTANQFSADQGYSEHQLGTTIDLTTAVNKVNFDEFANTATYIWLKNNAHKYGFTLSYSENNTYYKFEPWHWRFVGVELATDLYTQRKHFYDLEQRKIDEYLVNIFD